jgi:hypothetical protein
MEILLRFAHEVLPSYGSTWFVDRGLGSLEAVEQSSTKSSCCTGSKVCLYLLHPSPGAVMNSKWIRSIFE